MESDIPEVSASNILDWYSAGEQNSVGVGGLQSSVGAGVGPGVRDGGKESRHGGMVARCFTHQHAEAIG